MDIIVEENVYDEPFTEREREGSDANIFEGETLVICSLASAAAKMILKDSSKAKKKRRKQTFRKLICCLRVDFDGEIIEEDDLERLKSESAIKNNPLFIRQKTGSKKRRKMSVSAATDVERIVVYETLKSYCLVNILEDIF